MGIFNELSTAINSYGSALSLLPRKGIRRYLLMPVVLNILLLGGTVWVSILFGGEASRWVVSIIPQWEFLEKEWVQVVLDWVVRILVLLIYFTVYKYLVLIVLSPFLAFLSERVEKEQTGSEYPFSIRQLLRDMGRALVINLRNFLFEIVATLLLSIFAFLPVVGLVAPVLILIVQSYFFGFALMDYNAERHQFSWRQTEKWMRAHFWGVCGTGIVFHFTFLIPVVGWIIAPVWSTVAGTLTFLKLHTEQTRVYQ